MHQPIQYLLVILVHVDLVAFVILRTYVAVLLILLMDALDLIVLLVVHGGLQRIHRGNGVHLAAMVLLLPKLIKLPQLLVLLVHVTQNVVLLH